MSFTSVFLGVPVDNIFSTATIKLKLSFLFVCACLSVVRRTFPAHNNGESPATAASLTPGAATQAGWTANELATSTSTASALLPAENTTPFEGVGNGSHGLTRIALSASEGDLPALSLVLDTALSILFARAAVVHVLAHIAAESRPQHPVLPVTFSCPSLRFEPPTTKGPAVSTGVEGVFPIPSTHGPRGGETTIVRDVAHGILDTLLVPEDQHRIVDLTKALASW